MIVEVFGDVDDDDASRDLNPRIFRKIFSGAFPTLLSLKTFEDNKFLK